MSKAKSWDITLLEYNIFQVIQEIRNAQPPLELRKDLYTAALQHAQNLLHKRSKSIKEGFKERKVVFRDAKRYVEINFITKKGEKDEDKNIKIISELLRRRYSNKIQSGINGIGLTAIQLKSAKVLVVIFGGFFRPAIPLKLFFDSFPDIRSLSQPATDFNFLMTLFNRFREMIRFTPFVNLPAKGNSHKTLMNEERTWEVQRVSELFSRLLADSAFFDNLTEMWTGFSFVSQQNNSTSCSLKMTFYRNEESSVYEINVKCSENKYTQTSSESQSESVPSFQQEPIPFQGTTAFAPSPKKERWHRISDTVETQPPYDDSQDYENIPKELRKSHKTVVPGMPSGSEGRHSPRQLEDQFVDESGVAARDAQLKEELNTQTPTPVSTEERPVVSEERPTVSEERPETTTEEAQQPEVESVPSFQQEPIPFQGTTAFAPSPKKERWHRISDTVETQPPYDDSQDYENIPKELRKSHKTIVPGMPSGSEGRHSPRQLEDQFVDESGVAARDAQLKEELNTQTPTPVSTEERPVVSEERPTVSEERPETTTEEAQQPEVESVPSFQQEPIPFQGTTAFAPSPKKERWHRISDTVETQPPYDDSQDYENIPKELRKSHKTVVPGMPSGSEGRHSPRQLEDQFVDESGVAARDAQLKEELNTQTPTPVSTEERPVVSEERPTVSEERPETTTEEAQQPEVESVPSFQQEPIPFQGTTAFAPSPKKERWHRISDTVETQPPYDDSQDYENIPKELRKSHKTVVPGMPSGSEGRHSPRQLEDQFVDESGVAARDAQLKEELNTQTPTPVSTEERPVVSEERPTVSEERPETTTEEAQQPEVESVPSFQQEPIPFQGTTAFAPSPKKERWHRISDTVETQPPYDDSQDYENIPKELRKSHKTVVPGMPSGSEGRHSPRQLEDQFVDESGVAARDAQLKEELNTQTPTPVSTEERPVVSEERPTVSEERPETTTEEAQQPEVESVPSFQQEPIPFQGTTAFAPSPKKERWHRISDTVETQPPYDDSQDYENIPKELRKSHKTIVPGMPSGSEGRHSPRQLEDQFVDESGVAARDAQLKEELNTQTPTPVSTEERPVVSEERPTVSEERPTVSEERPETTTEEAQHPEIETLPIESQSTLTESTDDMQDIIDLIDEITAPDEQIPESVPVSHPEIHIEAPTSQVNIDILENVEAVPEAPVAILLDTKEPMQTIESTTQIREDSQPEKHNTQKFPISQDTMAADDDDSIPSVIIVDSQSEIPTPNIKEIAANVQKINDPSSAETSPVRKPRKKETKKPTVPVPQAPFIPITTPGWGVVSKELAQAQPYGEIKPNWGSSHKNRRQTTPSSSPKSPISPINQPPTYKQPEPPALLSPRSNNAWAQAYKVLTTEQQQGSQHIPQQRKIPQQNVLSPEQQLQQQIQQQQMQQLQQQQQMQPQQIHQQIPQYEQFNAPVEQSRYQNPQIPMLNIRGSIEHDPQPLSSPKNLWKSFAENVVPYDDKNDVRKLPPELRRSHQKMSPRGDLGSGRNSTRNSAKNSAKSSAKNSGESSPRAIDYEEAYQQQVELEQEEAQQQIPIPKMECDSQWAQIRSVLNEAEPYDDSKNVRHLAPELRRTHQKSPVPSQEERRTPASPSRGPRRQSIPSPPVKRVEGTPVEESNVPHHEPPVPTMQNTSSSPFYKPNSLWANIDANVPFDDSKVVRKTPVELRRSHNKITAEQPPPPQSSSKIRRQRANSDATPKNRSQRKNEQFQHIQQILQNVQQVEQQRAEESQPQPLLSPRAADVWKNLRIKPEIPRPKSPVQRTAPIQQPVQVASPTHVPVLEPEPEPEPVKQLEPEEHVEVDESRLQQLRKPITDAWAAITPDTLKTPPKKEVKKVAPQPIQHQIPVQPVPQLVVQEELQQTVQNQQPVPEQAQPNEVVEEVSVEDEPREVESLTPSIEKITAWSIVGNIQPFDDSKEVNKLPPELRRTHNSPKIASSPQEETEEIPKKKKSPRQKKPKSPRQQKQEEQPLESEQPMVQEEPKEPFVEQQQSQQSPVSPLPITSPTTRSVWANIKSDEFFDDSKEYRHLPAELKRSHKKPESSSPRREKTSPRQKEQEVEVLEYEEPQKPSQTNRKFVEEQTSPVPESIPSPSKFSVPSSPWANIDINSPYDDSKVPRYRRNSYQSPPSSPKVHQEQQQNTIRSPRGRIPFPTPMNQQQKRQPQQEEAPSPKLSALPISGGNAASGSLSPRNLPEAWANFDPTRKPEKKESPKSTPAQQQPNQQEGTNFSIAAAIPTIDISQTQDQKEEQQHDQQQLSPRSLKKNVSSAWANLNIASLSPRSRTTFDETQTVTRTINDEESQPQKKSFSLDQPTETALKVPRPSMKPEHNKVDDSDISPKVSTMKNTSNDEDFSRATTPEEPEGSPHGMQIMLKGRRLSEPKMKSQTFQKTSPTAPKKKQQIKTIPISPRSSSLAAMPAESISTQPEIPQNVLDKFSNK